MSAIEESMKLLDAYNPAQIRACGAMLEALKGKRSPEELIAFARTLRDPKIQSAVSHYRLLLPRVMGKALSNEEFLLAIGWVTLRAWRKLESEFAKRKIEPSAVKRFVSSERRKWLAEGASGAVRP